MDEFEKLIPALADLPAPPKRIILHWTAGTHTPNLVDLAHYHFLVTGEPEIVLGSHGVADNMRKLGDDTPYAAHTRRLNTYSVGVSFCGMKGAVQGGTFGKWPITREQFTLGFRFVAALCETWHLDPMDDAELFTHYEAEFLHHVDQFPPGPGSWKWDIAAVSFMPDLTKNEVGPWIRTNVRRSMTDRLLDKLEIDRIEPELSDILDYPPRIVAPPIREDDLS